MRIILKPIDNFANLLNSISSPQRQALHDWFYNASDSELKHAIFILNLPENSDLYPRHHLKEYIKFAHCLLQGGVPEPPSDLDLFTTPALNHYSLAKGGILLYSILNYLTKMRIQLTFKKLSLRVLIKPGPVFFQSHPQLTRSLAMFCRIFMSRIYISYNQIFSTLMRKTHFKEKKFRTFIQNRKTLLKAVREMVIKGKVNLEQRALWTWLVVLEESKYGKIGGVKEDENLFKLVAHNSNLRYFHLLKERFDLWKSLISLNLQSLLSTSPENSYRSSRKSYIKYHFKKKLKKRLQGLKNFIYNHLSDSFAVLKTHSSQMLAYYHLQLRLISIKPHFRNLAHLKQKLLRSAFKTWMNYQGEYEYEETIITVSQERKNFKVINKPIVLLDYYEDCKVNKTLIRNLTHILIRKLRNFWQTWNRNMNIGWKISGDDTLDLEEFKLPYNKQEKLAVIVAQLISINQVRLNLPRVGLTHWMQKADKRNLIVFKLRSILNDKIRLRQMRNRALTSFKLYSIHRAEFTDVL